MRTRPTLAAAITASVALSWLALAGPAPVARAQSPPTAEATDAARQRAKALDTLFASLAKATSPDEAQALTVEIWRQWSHSDQPGVELLMGQAAGAMASRNYGLAVLLPHIGAVGVERRGVLLDGARQHAIVGGRPLET